MFKALLGAVFACLLVVGPASAKTLEVPGLKITLGTKACTNKKVTVFTDQAGVTKDFKEATVVFEGKKIAACWAPTFDKQGVIIVDETGDGGIVPEVAFK
jgi:hypothetical protein